MKLGKRISAFLAVLLLAACTDHSDGGGVAASFIPVDIELADYDLLDFGVVDVNNDLDLDVYTINHSAAQSLLIANGRGEYQDRLNAVGLAQTSHYPGVEDSADQPMMARPGWYIYRQNKLLHLVAHKSGPLGALSGTLQAPWPLEIVAGEARLSGSESTAGTAVGSRVEFSLRSGDHLTIAGKDSIVEVPHLFALAEQTPLSNVYLGRQRMNPQSAGFTLMWRDRHSMSWADLNSDGLIDVYIGRGGLKGKIKNIAQGINDEILVQGENGFEDQTLQYALQKGACPGRRSEWVDVDDDSDLDLYLSCGRGSINDFPDALFINQDNTLAIDTTRNIGYTAESVITWVDLDTDGDSDLLSVEGDELAVYYNKRGSFTRVVVASHLPPRFRKFSIADLDNDGDPDIYLAGRVEAWLLLAEEGALQAMPPAAFGLPANAETANWVDFNNDGLLDLHTIPGGLYQQQADGTFHDLGQIHEVLAQPRISAARCSWYDVDGNGTRDALCAVQRYAIAPLRWLYKLLAMEHKVYFWETLLLKNKAEGGNWLAVKLNGPVGNPQAIGAFVSLSSTSGAVQTQHIGQNEGAHFGQGHYRLYFGLGDIADIPELVVTWPGGERQTLENVAVNQLLQVDSPRAARH